MTTIKNLLIVLILIILAFFMFSNPKYVENGTIISVRVDTFYKHDTIRKYKKGDMIPFAVLDTLYLLDSIKFHDTIKIIQDYNQVKVYSDTLRINMDNFVYIQDTISQNKIFGRGYNAHFTEKTIVKVRELRTPPKAGLYWGIMATKQEDNFGYGGGLIYKSANKGIIQLNITNNKQFQLGYYSKIF
jgi:hypothetical protein